MRQAQRASLVALVCALSVAPAVARIGEGDWEVGFGLGATEFDSSVSDETGTYFNVRGGCFLSDLLQFRAATGRVAGTQPS